ncbi:MAG: rRNA biogenesis protein rrp5 [Aristaeellaceae bacterium]
MSKMKLLLDVVDDMRRLADSLQTVADGIAWNTDAGDQLDHQQPAAQPEKPKAPVITIDQVRTLLAEKSGEGKTQAVKALLYKYDAGKLSGVKQEDYAALMEEARKL